MAFLFPSLFRLFFNPSELLPIILTSSTLISLPNHHGYGYGKNRRYVRHGPLLIFIFVNVYGHGVR